MSDKGAEDQKEEVANAREATPKILSGATSPLVSEVHTDSQAAKVEQPEENKDVEIKFNEKVSKSDQPLLTQECCYKQITPSETKISKKGTDEQDKEELLDAVSPLV